MQTHLTSGASYGRTRRLYVWGLSRSKHKWRNRLALCVLPSPAAAAQARPAVGGALRGDDTPLAAGRQKYRWPPWLGLGCHVVRALGGVDAGEAPQRTRHGVVSGRECRGAGIHWPPERPQPPDSGSFQYCSGLYSLGQGRGRGGQGADSPCRQGLGLCRYQSPLVRYDSAGVAHWLSQRTEHFAGGGAALWQSFGEAQKAWGVGGRQGARPGTDKPQIGQRTPSLCQEQRRKASGVDTPAEGGRAVDRTNPSHGGAPGAAPRSCDPKRHSNAGGYARGRQAAHPAERAVDHDWSGGQGQNRACRGDAGAGDRPQQGGEEGGIWPALSPESPRRRVSLWDIDSGHSGRVQDAFTGLGRVPRYFWSARYPRVVGLRSGRRCHGHAEGVGPRGDHPDWHPAQRPAGVARCRGSPSNGQERTRQDRRHHWYSEDGQIWVQQAQGTSVAHAGDGRSPVSPLLQSEQTDARSGAGQQVRRKDIGTDRTAKTALVEREEAGQDAPCCPQGSFATRSIYAHDMIRSR